MKKFVIERELPGIGSAPADALQGAAKKSNAALAELGENIQWIHSYLTADKSFCVYYATDEAVIRKHSELSGIPATTISEVTTTIDPTTARG